MEIDIHLMELFLNDKVSAVQVWHLAQVSHLLHKVQQLMSVLGVIGMKLIKRVFIIYCIILTIVLLFKYNLSLNSIMEKINSVSWSREQGAWNINLVPFRTISSQLSLFGSIPAIVAKNLVGNIVVFIPFGSLLPLGYEKMRKCHRTLLAGLLYILFIELIQFVCMLGTFDVDDIILNSLGVFVGFIIFKIILKAWRHRLPVIDK